MNSIEFIEKFIHQEIELYGDELAITFSETERKSDTDQPAWQETDNLNAFSDIINTCTLCPLAKQRNHFVFGNGNPDADIMIIGDKPGPEDDKSGLIFVGPDGKLLDKILDAIGLKRWDVYLCNLVKCQPEENRSPQPFEIDRCRPYLLKQIELIDPSFILCLGHLAATSILEKNRPMEQLRGEVIKLGERRVIVTHHPGTLLKNRDLKRETWHDVQLLQKLYNQKTG